MTALAALHTALFNRLRTGTQWGDVYADMAPADTPRPYVVFIYAGGGELLFTQDAQNARLVITVKAVADTQAAAFAGAAEIETLLRSQGTLEGGGLTVTNGWNITAVTQDRVIHLTETYQGAKPIYNDGHQYVFMMERDI
ncbi:MAG: hypothetical protein AAF787_00240 [Chloroflexota bacterium]